ncbi:hydroquinone glucosyltransferase-like [Glycine soja]|uniref:Glycosyltransferase n=2 Tax=Glycine soja TaxID=3848 RepID=A0A445JNR7_GLYSO|nr:hydroquinone glucosyltransferase-like [Glycine soja]RZC00106.1 Hydroquinone glucosyltransferase [Glycine soja]
MPEARNKDSMAKTTHIAVISIPAFSHQASIVEFSKRLVHLHRHFHVYCIFPTIDAPPPATLAMLESLPSNINYNFLPPVHKQDLSHDDAPSMVQIDLAVSQSMPSFRHMLGSLLSTTPLVALIADPFANEALEIAKEFNLLSYIYFPPSAMTLSLFLQLPALHEQVSCEYRDNKEAIQLPGCVPIQGHDLPSHFQDRSNLAYKLILERCKRLSLANGFLVNSFSNIEEGTERALQEHNSSSVYLIGPIIQTGLSSESKGSECVGWLDKQSPNSVLYVSFGSGGTLSQQQLNELAFGLELSDKKFLWVLRAPSDSADGAYVVASKDDPLKFLPDGFLERTKGRGFVVTSWAPQTQILSHVSTGGFLTHCGWNSALESIVLGVPMVTWPLFAEQRMNAVLLTEGLKVALRPKFNENGVAEREEIAKVIKGLMVGEEGNEIRERIEKIKDASADALKEDGSSTKALYQFGTQMEKFLEQP